MTNRRPSRLPFILVFAMLLACLTPCVDAAYLRDMPQTLTQPDGSTVACFASGDEFYHWLHDENGFVIVRDSRSGEWVWAAKKDGRLVPTEHVVGRVAPELVDLEPNLRPDPWTLSQKSALLDAPELGRAPSTGTIQNIVIFIRFADDAEYTDLISPYDSAFNSLTAGSSSVAAYFDEVSNQQLAITSTFYPTPPATTVISHQDAQPRAYYQPYDETTNPIGYTDYDDRTTREHTLLKNAVDGVSSQIPGSLVVDGDGDELVDNVAFVIKGEGDGWSDLLWPHRWSLYTQSAYINGKRVMDYNFQLSEWLGVGVLCHEMFHSLGSPDLYHYSTCSSDTSIDPVAGWDLMEWTSSPPQHMLTFMKHRYGGWIASVPEITANGTYSLNPSSSETNNCYKIASPNSATEYFMVEYRKQEGTFESSVPGSGLIVYRIDTTQDGLGNRCGPPDEVYIYRPGGTLTVNGSPNSAHLSSDVSRTEINDSTDPSSFLSDGGPGGLILYDVGTVGATISFTVSLCTTSMTTSSSTFTAAGGSGSIDITAEPGCAWTATATESWITIDSGSSGSGNGTVSFSVAANSALSSRTGGISVAGTTHAVSQQGSGTELLAEDFEGAASDWSTEGLWHLSTACLSSSGSHSPATAFYFGNDGTCTYATGARATGFLTSPTIDLGPGSTELSFNYLLGTEQWPAFDSASVEVWSAASGWTVIDTDVTNGGALADDGAAWQDVTYDLSSYANETIQIRFGFDSVDGTLNDYPGFYVDDVTVVGEGASVDGIFSDGFESGDTTLWSGSVP